MSHRTLLLALALCGYAWPSEGARASDSLAATATTQPAPEAMIPASEPPALEDVTAVPTGLEARLRRAVLDRPSNGRTTLERLVEFMFDPQGLGLVYREDATYTVSETYAARRVNCLSFTLLFLALAREVGLDAYPQIIEETLSSRQHDDTIYRTHHVNAGVNTISRRLTVDVASDLFVAKRPPARTSNRRLLALYYDNRATELMLQGDNAAALRFIAIATGLDPDYASHWSNAGVIHLRNGDLEQAHAHYLKALSLSPRHSGALFNLVGLSTRNGDRQAQAFYTRQLERVRERDPFHHYLLATEYAKRGDAARAIERYRHAIRLHPGEHRFHFGLANAYLQLGDVPRASRELAQAVASSEGGVHDFYRTKLARLRAPLAGQRTQ